MFRATEAALQIRFFGPRENAPFRIRTRTRKNCTCRAKKDAISSLVSAVKKTAIDEGCRDGIKEELVNRVILKEMKTVKEQIDSCPAERTDLLAEYQQRYDIMSEYAPAMLSEEEVRKILTEKFADVIATKNKGQIMKTVMPELKGKADGKLIGQVVAELCK